MGKSRSLAKNERVIASQAVAINGKPTEYRIDGCNGLTLIAQPTGNASYYFSYTNKDGARRRLKLGAWDATSLKRACELADANRTLVNEGGDPLADRHSRREALTVAELVERYEEKHLPTLSAETQAAYRHCLRKHILGTEKKPSLLRNKLAVEVTREDVVDLVSWVAEHGGPKEKGALVMADKVRAVLSSVFAFAINSAAVKGLRENPARGVQKKSSGDGRQRDIAPNELKAIWNGLDETGISEPIKLIIRLTILTGSRRAEVVAARREELDLDAARWVIPGAVLKKGKLVGGRTKNRRTKIVPLPLEAVALFRRALEISDGRQSHVFPAHETGEAFESIDPHSVTRAMRRLTADLKIDDLRLHDTRGACRTWLKANGHDRDVRDHVLGHVGQDVGSRHYEAVSEEFIEKRVRPALQAWAQHVMHVVGASNVVPLKRRA